VTIVVVVHKYALTGERGRSACIVRQRSHGGIALWREKSRGICGVRMAEQVLIQQKDETCKPCVWDATKVNIVEVLSNFHADVGVGGGRSADATSTRKVAL